MLIKNALLIRHSSSGVESVLLGVVYNQRSQVTVTCIQLPTIDMDTLLLV